MAVDVLDVGEAAVVGEGEFEDVAEARVAGHRRVWRRLVSRLSLTGRVRG